MTTIFICAYDIRRRCHKKSQSQPYTMFSSMLFLYIPFRWWPTATNIHITALCGQ